MTPNNKTLQETFDLDTLDRERSDSGDGDDVDDLQGLLAEEERAVASHESMSPITNKISRWFDHRKFLACLLTFLHALRPATFDLAFKHRSENKELRPSAYLDGLRGLGALSVYCFHTIGSHGSAREGYGQNE